MRVYCLDGALPECATQVGHTLLAQVAKALVEFETLWHQAWLKGIEQQKAGLQAPLLVRHPDTGALIVNLDKDVMQLIR